MIERQVRRLASLGVRCQGFWTAETLQKKGDARDGFDIVCHPSGVRRALARKAIASGVDSSAWRARTGPYKVDVSAIDEAVVPLLTAAKSRADVYVIDEIGRMEMHSEKFCQAVEALYQSGSLLFGSVAAPRYGHVVPYCEDLKKRKDVCVLGLKKSTREEVAVELQSRIQEMLGEKLGRRRAAGAVRKRRTERGAGVPRTVKQKQGLQGR